LEQIELRGFGKPDIFWPSPWSADRSEMAPDFVYRVIYGLLANYWCGAKQEKD